MVWIEPEDDRGHEVNIRTGLEKGDVWIHCASNDGRAGCDVNVHVWYDDEGPNGWEDFVSFGGHNYYRVPGHYSWYTA